MIKNRNIYIYIYAREGGGLSKFIDPKTPAKEVSKL